MSDEFSPCAHCGSKLIEVDSDSLGWYACCTECGINLFNQKEITSLAAAWNRRAAPAQSAPVVNLEALKQKFEAWLMASPAYSHMSCMRDASGVYMHKEIALVWLGWLEDELQGTAAPSPPAPEDWQQRIIDQVMQGLTSKQVNVEDLRAALGGAK